MKISVTVSFDRQEASDLRMALLPIARLADYPDLLSELEAHGVEDLARGKAIATNLGTIRADERTDAFDGPYLRKAAHLLVALGKALGRDLTLKDSATPADLQAAVIEARGAQIAALVPARDILRVALSCAGSGLASSRARPTPSYIQPGASRAS